MTRKYWSDKEINFIKNNLANMTISEMARHFNVSYDKMADKIHKMGLNRKKISGKLWSEKEDLLLKKHFEYAPKNYLMNLFPNRTWYGILQRGLKTLNLNRKTQDRYSVNYNFFENWNEISAYIYGFILADGHVFYEKGKENKNALQIELASYDVDILEKIKKELNYEGSICYTKRDTVKLQINNKKIIKDLINKGMPHINKTNEAAFPNTLPEIYYKDFVRGIFDGDGCISFSRKNMIAFQLTGTKKTLESIKSILPVDMSKIHVIDRNKYNINVFFLTVSGKKAINIFEWLYKDATIYLERKYNKYMNLLKEIKQS